MTNAIFTRTHYDSFESLRNTSPSSPVEPFIDVQALLYKPSSSELEPSVRSHSYSNLFQDQSPSIDPGFIGDLNHEDSTEPSFELSPLVPHSPTGFLAPFTETYKLLRSNEIDILHLLHPVYREETSSPIGLESELAENYITFPYNQSLSIEDICGQLPNFESDREMNFNQNLTDEPEYVFSVTKDPALPLIPPVMTNEQEPVTSSQIDTPAREISHFHNFRIREPSERSEMCSIAPQGIAPAISKARLDADRASQPVPECENYENGREIRKRKSHDLVTETSDSLKKLKSDKEKSAPTDNLVHKCLYSFKAGLILRYIDDSINHRWRKLFNTKFLIAENIFPDYQQYLGEKQINIYVAKPLLVTKVFLVALSNIPTDSAEKSPDFFYLPSKAECRARIDQLKQSMEEVANPMKTSVGKFLISSLKPSKQIWNFEGTMSLRALHRQYAVWINKEELYHQLNEQAFKDSLCNWLPCLKFLDNILTIPSREICIQSFQQMKAERLSKVFTSKVK